MIVCSCKGVSDRAVRLAVMQGARSVEAVAAACGAGTGCGACIAMLDQMASEGSSSPGQASRCHNTLSAVPSASR